MVVESDSALVSGLRPVVSDPALVSVLQLVVSDTARVSVPPVAGCEFLAALLGKVAFDAVGLGVGPPCFRVDSEDALLKRTDERALLARAAPGVIPEMKLVTKFWMMGRRETMTGVKSLKYVLQMTASVWMPFNQTCDEESGDADFDSFKTAPWDARGTQRDEVHETMWRARVHNIDGSTTKNTECVFPTNMLLAMNYGGTRIGGDLHDTVAISDGHTRRKDEDILRRSAVCVEVDIPADMNCTVVELSDVTILRRRLPQGQDSAEHQECCISISNTAVEFNDVIFRWLRLPWTEVLANRYGGKVYCIKDRYCIK